MIIVAVIIAVFASATLAVAYDPGYEPSGPKCVGRAVSYNARLYAKGLSSVQARLFIAYWQNWCKIHG